MAHDKRCHVLIPGDWQTRTGGFVYDRRMVLALRAAGWQVEVMELKGRWPLPGRAERRAAAAAIAALPDGACVLADGLAFGALSDEVAPHAQRLCWVALVHHPLHLETGLDAATVGRLREAEAAALRHARHVVVTSPATVSDVTALGVPTERVSVVVPGSDPIAATGGCVSPGEDVQLLCVATLTARKGHAVLLQALASLTHLPWTLHCVGSPRRDAALARRLQASTARGPLSGRVVWHGELDDAALHARYRAADLLVLASQHEGHGMVIDEALRHGLPIVASDAGALRQTVPADAGVHLPASDVAAWRHALAQVLTDAGTRQRMARAARAAAQALPDWPTQAKRLARVLQTATAAHAREAARPAPPPPAPERFAATWLTLREPFDAAARDAAAVRLRLPTRLAALAPRSGPWRVLDLGCGTGANLRWLAPRLGGEQEWLGIDHDARLLRHWVQTAGAHQGRGQRGRAHRDLCLSGPGHEARVVLRSLDLAQALERLPWAAAHLVTASALLDLVSASWLQRLADQVSRAGVAVLFALSVDGRHAWTPPDAHDATVNRLFAAHQRREKGFGPALGAAAVPLLADLLRARGYRVHTARSDWWVDAGSGAGQEGALWTALVKGMGDAAAEQDPAQARRVAAWQGRRWAAPGTLRLGHTDLLALPPT